MGLGMKFFIVVAIILFVLVLLAALLAVVGIILAFVLKKKPSDKALPREIPENYDAVVMGENKDIE